MSLHKSTIQNSLGSDWFRVETLKSAFEKPDVDWDYISEKRALICDSSILKNERRFNTRLSEKVRGFVKKELGTEGFEPFSLVTEFFENSTYINPAANYLVNLMSYSDDSEKEE